ncbi:hypothetical protein DID88_010347 [Monilinia fructigena]|uniref:Cytochrome P450 n=1 Tax=Monilinia fructigena TaxID=38457 RepID=A0A395INX1_9HELO|nr:hypothetical protein DID88_010347 [Monilinia fructigena]
MTYYKLTGVLPYKFKELHDKYGDALRVAPNYLDYNSSVAWEDIYGFVKDHHKKNFPKDLVERGVMENEPRNIIVADEEDHRRFRRLQSHVFSDKALTSQEPLIQDYARRFISGLIKFSSLNSDGSINIGQWYNYTTFDLIGDLAFGEPFGCVETGEMHPWIQLIFKVLEISILINESKKYPILGAIVYFFIPRDIREKGMTREEIGNNASLLIIAGSETTASLLNGVTYHLLQSPTILQNLTLELRTIFKSQDDLTLHALAACKYLNAVLEEGLRMYPQFHPLSPV